MDFESLNNLYIIIAAKGVANVESYDSDLRLLDNDLDRGVKALYDNEQETIIAFLFQRGSYTEEKAKEWVAEVEKEGVNLTAASNVTSRPTFLLPVQVLETAVEDLSFADVEGLLREALESDGVSLEDGSYRWPWLIEVHAEYCIVGLGPRYYKVPYTLNDYSKIEFGELQQVTRRWEPVPIEDAGRGEAEAEEAQVEELCVSEPKDQEASDAMAADIHGGERRVLTFEMHDPVGLPAEVETGDLVWKEIFHVSKTVRPISGDVLSVEQEMIDGLAEAFDAKVFSYVPITASTHHDETGGIVPSYDSVGFVRKVVKIDGRLFGGLDLIDEDVQQKIGDGRIADCSVYVWFDVYDRKDPEKVWPFVLVHLLLTNYPQIDDLEAFGVGPDAIAASVGEGAEYQHYVEETMSEEENTTPTTLDPEDAKLLEEIKELRKSGFTLDGLRQQAQKVQQKARGLEIQSVVAALEGTAVREDVHVIEGCRHYPAVIKAVEAALQSAHEAMGADVNEDGKTAADKLVLDIANALPAEARMQVSKEPPRPDRSTQETDADQPWQKPGHRTEPLPAEITKDVSDEAIDRFAEEMVIK